MSTTAKAIAMAHELADRLKNRKAISALTVVESFDTDQNPLIAIGTQASSDSAAFLVKVMPVSWPLAQDILGNSAFQYTPHEIRVLKEASSTGTTSEMIAQVYAQVAEMGADFKLYESSHGGGVVAADIGDDTKAITESWPDLYRPLISSQ
jgi:hypothetical protein